MTFFQKSKSKPWSSITISISQVRNVICEQKREMETGGGRAKEIGGRRWIIVEPEKELTLLLSHYCSSGGTNGFNSKRGRNII